MYKPSPGVCRPQDKICGVPAIRPLVRDHEREEVKASYSGSLLPPKMGFWSRLKYLFTGKVSKKDKSGPIDPPPVLPSEIDPGLQVASANYGTSYTTFAGCDMKVVFVKGLGEKPTREEITDVYLNGTGHGKLSPQECTMKGINKQEEHCLVVGEIQAISMKTFWDKEEVDRHSLVYTGDVVKVAGDARFIMFDRSTIKRIEEMGENVHVLLLAASEYGDLSTFVLPRFKITSWSWGIAVDDLVSEEVVEFEADEPMYWEQYPSNMTEILAHG
jgi:hypothetical protein